MEDITSFPKGYEPFMFKDNKDRSGLAITIFFRVIRYEDAES